MKIPRSLIVVGIASLLAAFSPLTAAEAEPKGKEKAKATRPSQPKASKEKPKSGKPKADELAEAEKLLASLSAPKRTALTKLLNSGTKEELAALPGIGVATAEAIIKSRPLKSAAHLVTVKGVGEKTFAKIVKSRK